MTEQLKSRMMLNIYQEIIRDSNEIFNQWMEHVEFYQWPDEFADEIFKKKSEFDEFFTKQIDEIKTNL